MRCLSMLLSAAFLILVPSLASAVTPPAVTAPVSVPAATNAPAATSPDVPAPSTFTAAQRTEIENILKDYLTKKNPEVLMEAMQELQKREQADAQNKSKTALNADHDKIYSNPMTPVGGNPNGSVVVVEFFDYACGYCKMSEPHIEKLLKENKDVKFVYKDYPILGPASSEAAKAALAAAKQGKYVQMHDKLMAGKIPHGASDPEAADPEIFRVAKEIGLNIDQLKKDMKDDAISKALDDNVALGMDVGARGTPTFIIGDNVYPGAMEYDQLKQTVADAAKSSTAKP